MCLLGVLGWGGKGVKGEETIQFQNHFEEDVIVYWLSDKYELVEMGGLPAFESLRVCFSFCSFISSSVLNPNFFLKVEFPCQSQI